MTWEAGPLQTDGRRAVGGLERPLAAERRGARRTRGEKRPFHFLHAASTAASTAAPTAAVAVRTENKEIRKKTMSLHL